MATEMHVEVSGEGDFRMESDSAWMIEVALGGERVTVESVGYGDLARISIRGWDPERKEEVEIWPPRDSWKHASV